MRRIRNKPEDLPAPGSVFAFQLADGRFGACRVLKLDVPEHSDRWNVLVGLSEYIGNVPSKIDDPSLRRLLRLNHHSWSNTPDTVWIDVPPPESFQQIGVIPIDSTDEIFDRHAHSAWEGFPLQRLLQWRWENDREALLLDEARQKALEEKRREEAAARRTEILANTTLDSILARDSLFPTWQDHPPTRVTTAAEIAIRAFISEIIKDPKQKRASVSRHLKTCIKTLNKIDADHSHPFATIEREDLFNLFEEILEVGKHPQLLDKIETWRDW